MEDSEEKFDAIVAGGGLAGIACAYTLAEAGLNVIMFERGDYCGSKNVTGGRLYVEPLRDMFPEVWEKAPLERPIIREEVSVLTSDDSLTVSYANPSFVEGLPQSYSINRAKFDKWFARKAQRKGALVIAKARVQELVVEAGVVRGARVDGEVFYADVTVLCEGVLGMLARSIGLAKPLSRASFAVGVKEVVELPPETIEDRFALPEGQGAARLYMGDVTEGRFGGGIVYTNESSLSIGVIAGLSGAVDAGSPLDVPGLLERFKSRKDVAPLIKGGSLAEYSAHVMAEAGMSNIARLYAPGVLVAGEAAGFAINDGLIVRGMDYAIASGHMAAEAIISAHEKGDYSAESLSAYERMLEDSFVLKDMRNFARVPENLDNARFFNYYPKLLSSVMSDVFTVGAGPKERMFPTLKRHLGFSELWAMARNDLKKVKQL